MIRHRNKGKNLRGAEQLEGPLPNGCSAPGASDPLYVLATTDLRGKRLTGAVARISRAGADAGFGPVRLAEHPGAVDGETGRCPGFYSLVGARQGKIKRLGLFRSLRAVTWPSLFPDELEHEAARRQRESEVCTGVCTTRNARHIRSRLTRTVERKPLSH